MPYVIGNSAVSSGALRFVQGFVRFHNQGFRGFPFLRHYSGNPDTDGNFFIGTPAFSILRRAAYGVSNFFGKGEGARGIDVGKKQNKFLAAIANRQLTLEALSHYRKAQDFLRKGEWAAYGNELRQMDDILRSFEGKK
jgi:hypothetical protein